MREHYSITAGFEDFDAPELIASAIWVLENHGWHIAHYEDRLIHASRPVLNETVIELTIEIQLSDVHIDAQGDIKAEALQHLVHEIVKQLSGFIAAPGFDFRVSELKHHYFMNNPLQASEASSPMVQESQVKSFFGFRKQFRATPAIILINALVYLLMVISGVHFFSPESAEILQWGGNIRTFVLQGDWWRLITCCFVHIGILHILLNMWALYNIGFFLERMIGSWRFVFAYLIAGIAGSLNSIVWHPATASAGASGAIFGMFGLFLALLTTNILEKGFRSSMLQSVLPMILFNLLIGTSAQIDNAGHIGGLLSGMLSGYLFAWHYKKPKSKAINLLSFLIPLILLAISGYFIAQKLPDPYREYDEIMQKVSNLEKKALDKENIHNRKWMNDSAILVWDEAIHVLQKAKSLNLHNELKVHNDQLIYYLNTRKKEAGLLIQESPNHDALKQVNQSIDSILSEINTKK